MISRKQLFVFAIVTVIIPLLFGAALYYILCPEVWFVRKANTVLGMGNRVPLLQCDSVFMMYLRFYFFDFIWSYALTNVIFIIFNNNAKPMIFCMFIPISLGTLMEMLQLFGLAQGTFDLWDIAAEFVGSIWGAFIIHTYLGGLKNEKIN